MIFITVTGHVEHTSDVNVDDYVACLISEARARGEFQGDITVTSHGFNHDMGTSLVVATGDAEALAAFIEMFHR